MEKKILAKLASSVLALALTTVLAVTTSYAWMTLAGSPEVDGIQITIGGSDTILVAADLTFTGQDGTVAHYPGEFSEQLNFLQYDTYDYLQNLQGLMPVSTSDGVHWLLPRYYEVADSRVQKGQAMVGELKEYSDFLLDTSLEYANLPVEGGEGEGVAGTDAAEAAEKAAAGHYIYLDFWVVSPASGYTLRVSAGSEEEGAGSYVISLPQPTEADTDADGTPDSYVLEQPEPGAAAAVRIGFLVNEDGARTEDVVQYLHSEDYDERYTGLLGQYQRQGESIELYAAARNRFTIYEPNGDLHADGTADYELTYPLGVTESGIGLTDVRDRLTVQKSSLWKQSAGSEALQTGENLLIGQEFRTAMAGRSFSAGQAEVVKEQFYRTRLAGQLVPYVTIGRFVANTGNLWGTAQAAGGILEPDADALRHTDGATADVYLTTLRKNMPQRIRMFIWIEGQDVDCVNQAAYDFAVNVELAGSNEAND